MIAHLFLFFLKILYSPCEVELYWGLHQDGHGYVIPHVCDPNKDWDMLREFTWMLDDHGHWVRDGDNQHFTVYANTCRCDRNKIIHRGYP